MKCEEVRSGAFCLIFFSYFADFEVVFILFYLFSYHKYGYSYEFHARSNHEWHKFVWANWQFLLLLLWTIFCFESSGKKWITRPHHLLLFMILISEKWIAQKVMAPCTMLYAHRVFFPVYAFIWHSVSHLLRHYFCSSFVPFYFCMFWQERWQIRFSFFFESKFNHCHRHRSRRRPHHGFCVVIAMLTPHFTPFECTRAKRKIL